MRVFWRIVALCAVIALVVTCTAGDPFGSPDDPDDESAIAFHLSPALPPARIEPEAALTLVGAVFVDFRPVHGRLAELDIFRPPRTCA